MLFSSRKTEQVHGVHILNVGTDLPAQSALEGDIKYNTCRSD
jgi:hypothetical protein